MKLTKRILALCLLVASATGCWAQSNSTTYRDANGNRTGTSTTDRYGRTTYRDANGNRTGTQTTDRYGRSTYRDANGNRTGSSTSK